MRSGRALVPALVAGLLVVIVLAWFTLGRDQGDVGPGGVPTGPGGEASTVEKPESAEPASGPTVAVHGRALWFGSGKPAADLVLTCGGSETRTGPDGAFTLPALPAGGQDLRFSPPGRDPIVERVEIVEGQPDLGDILLPSGTVLLGTVVDANGEPVAGASVRILERNVFRIGGWWSGPVVAQIRMGVDILDGGADAPGITASTDAKGEFRVEGLSPGKYYASASAPGNASGEVENFEIPPGGERRIAVTLGEASTIAGKVVDYRKQGVGGARVFAAPWNSAVKLPYAIMELGTSKPDGSFRFDRLEVGKRYLVFARAPDGKIGLGIRVETPKEDLEVKIGPRFMVKGAVVDDETGGPIAGAEVYAILGYAVSDELGRYEMPGMVKSPFFRQVWANADGYEMAIEELGAAKTMFAGASVDLDFRMKKVRPATLRVTARDVAGGPLADVEIALREWNGDAPYLTGRTNDLGEAVINGVLPNGTYVSAKKKGYQFVLTQDSPNGDRNAYPQTEQWVNPEPGGELPLEIVLAATTGVAGTVRDTAGQPVADVSVSAGGTLLGKTDEKGAFDVTGVPEGMTVPLVFARIGYLTKSETVLAAEGARMQVVIERGATVSGRVVDGTGEPVIGARITVRIDANDLGMSTETRKNGSFTLPGLPSGRCVLLVYKEGRPAVKTPGFVLASAEERSDLLIRVPEGVKVRLSFAAPDGAEIAGGAYVYGPLEKPEEERILYSRGTNGEEPVELAIAPGRYRILASPGQGVAGAGAVEIEKDLTAAGDLRIALDGEEKRIRVRLALPAGGRLRGASLTRVEPEIPRIHHWIQVQEGDVLTSPALPPGKYSVDVYYTPEGQQDTWVSVTAEDLEPGGKTVELKAPR